jgi:hypothetical protein
MRGVRSLIVLLVIAIALGWYTYRDSLKGPVDDSPAHEKLFTVEADKIDELQIKSEAGERTTLRKKGTAWEIVQPTAAPPDEAAVSGITSNLASVEIQRVIEENASDLKEFGLVEPRIEVAFKSGGSQEQRLQIGQKTPSGSDVYAKLADQKRVFLIPAHLESTFNRGTFELRDKSVLKLDREKVDGFEVSAGGRTIRFRKQNGDWQMTEPAASRADFSAIDGLVSRVSGVQMKAVEPPDSPDSKKYGLDPPAATVRVGSGSSQATLVLGAAAGNGDVYAKDLARPIVFTVEPALLEDLKKDASEYRQKDLFDARSFSATRLEIVRNGQIVAFEKAKVKDTDGKEEEKWRQTLPAQRDVDAAKVEGLITAITGARATGFTDTTATTGLDKPELTVAFKYDQNKDERVTFARSGGSAHAARGGNPGAATVDAAVLDGIIKALEDIK